MSSPLPKDLPASFWADLPTTEKPVANLPPAPTGGQWQPTKMMYWYDSIIDDFLANPGTTVKETAARLGRNPVTISLIARSDLFKARYAQRRSEFNEDLDQRLTGKLAKIAETSLDLTLEVLEAKRDKVPLPQLIEIQNKALDRLGYGTSTSSNPSVVIHNNNSASAAAQSGAVTPEVLAEARRKLRLVEASKLSPEAEDKRLPVVEAGDLGGGSEGAS